MIKRFRPVMHVLAIRAVLSWRRWLIQSQSFFEFTEFPSACSSSIEIPETGIDADAAAR